MNTLDSTRRGLTALGAISALSFALFTQAPRPCLAQFPGPGALSQYGYPAAPAAPAATTAPLTLPDGVDQLYALEGTNTLLATATPEGYERLRELVRNIDGDLDIVQTKVASVTLSSSDLMALSVTPSPSMGLLTSTDAVKLIAALQNGRLTAGDTVRITTRENTAVDTLLRLNSARFATGGTPFALVPRETRDGSLALEILQPLSASVSVRSGETAVLATPGMTSETVRLLFLTPVVLPSNQRLVR